jgi:hypothetical protein
MDTPDERVFASIGKRFGPIFLIIDPLILQTRERFEVADFFSLKMIDFYFRVVAHVVSLPINPFD